MLKIEGIILTRYSFNQKDYENENEHVKTHDFMRILDLQSPIKKQGGDCRIAGSGAAYIFRVWRSYA